jgi:DNA repair exonuclease SbcCD ATPase subunit
VWRFVGGRKSANQKRSAVIWRCPLPLCKRQFSMASTSTASQNAAISGSKTQNGITAADSHATSSSEATNKWRLRSESLQKSLLASQEQIRIALDAYKRTSTSRQGTPRRDNPHDTALVLSDPRAVATRDPQQQELTATSSTTAGTSLPPVQPEHATPSMTSMVPTGTTVTVPKSTTIAPQSHVVPPQASAGTTIRLTAPTSPSTSSSTTHQMQTQRLDNLKHDEWQIRLQKFDSARSTLSRDQDKLFDSMFQALNEAISHKHAASTTCERCASVTSNDNHAQQTIQQRCNALIEGNTALEAANNRLQHQLEDLRQRERALIRTLETLEAERNLATERASQMVEHYQTAQELMQDLVEECKSAQRAQGEAEATLQQQDAIMQRLQQQHDAAAHQMQAIAHENTQLKHQLHSLQLQYQHTVEGFDAEREALTNELSRSFPHELHTI